MDDLLWNGSWNNSGNDDGGEESLFGSDDLSRCSSPPLQELQTVARIMGLPDVRPEELAKDYSKNFLSDREKLCRPAGVSSGGVLLEELKNEKGNLNL